MADRRTQARQVAMQALYQLDAQGDNFAGDLALFFRENCSDQMTADLAKKWTLGCKKNITRCDEAIEKAAIKWKLNRLAVVDRNILRLSVYQLLFCLEIPPKVVINEAIELAKSYGTEKSSSFVNGVLDAVLKTIVSEGEK